MAWNTYKDVCPSPECGAEVVRQNKRRLGFCRGTCNILLDIPSYRETEKTRVHLVQFGKGGQPQKITREEYFALKESIESFERRQSWLLSCGKELAIARVAGKR